MYEYIPKIDVDTVLDNLKTIKHIDSDESMITLAYKKGYMEALEQVRLELNQPCMKARMLMLRYVKKEDDGR